jgi:hypothetical protein
VTCKKVVKIQNKQYKNMTVSSHAMSANVAPNSLIRGMYESYLELQSNVRT